MNEQEKSTELTAINSVQNDELDNTSSANSILRDNGKMQENWLSMDNVELFDTNHKSFEEEKSLNVMQIALQKALDKERGMIPDNVTLPCSIDRGEFYYTSSSNIPIVKMVSLVNDSTSNPKYVEDFFIFGDDYVDNTIERLNTVLSRFNYHLTNEDLKDFPSIAEAINRLKGRTAKIKQYEKNGDKKYWYYHY